MNIKRTQFTNFGTTDISYGFRAYTDESQTYSNLLEREELIQSDEEFLRTIIDLYADDTFTEMFDFVFNHTNVIIIDDVEYRTEVCGDKWKLVEKN